MSPSTAAESGCLGDARSNRQRRAVRRSGAQSHSRVVLNEANRIVIERYAPPSVLVDQNFHVVQFNGQTGPYLEPSPGEPSFHVLKLAREGLLHGLRTALQTARKTRKATRRQGLRVRNGTDWHDIEIEVLPDRAAEPDLLSRAVREAEDDPAKSVESRERPAAAQSLGSSASRSSKRSWPRHASICSRRFRKSRPRTKSCSRRTRRSSRATKSCRAPTRSWTRPKKSCSRPTKSSTP